MWAEHDDAVQPEWLDGNGHMNLAYYVLVFDRGTDAWLEMAGLGRAYRDTGHSVFAVETHTSYRREVHAGAPLHVRTRLLEHGGKRIHLMHEMRSHAAEVAVQEALFLHMDMTARRPVDLMGAAAVRVAALAPPPGWLRPAWLGRRVGQQRASAM